MMNRFPSGIWAVALLVSILLNGMILGAVAAGALRLGAQPGFSEVRSDPPFSGGMPDGMRGELAERLRREARETRPLLREAREANAAVAGALTADPFDAEAARAAFDRAGAARAALEARANDVTIDIFSGLPLAARQDMMRWRERRGDGDGGPRFIFREERRTDGRPDGFGRDGGRPDASDAPGGAD